MSAIPSAAGESLTPSGARAVFRRHWGWLLAFGIVQLLAGALAIAAPALASFVAVVMFGWVMIVAAVFQIAHAIRVRKWPGFALHLLGGALYAAAGVLALLYPFPGMLALTLLVAGLLLAEGVLRVALAASTRKRRQEGWGWFLAGGIASVALGAMLIAGFPATAVWAIGVMLGVNLLVSGAANATLALTCRRKHLQTGHDDSGSRPAAAPA